MTDAQLRVLSDKIDQIFENEPESDQEVMMFGRQVVAILDELLPYEERFCALISKKKDFVTEFHKMISDDLLELERHIKEYHA